jgi:hypothetical protein
MVWALLAAFLTRRPAWVQALVFGLCSGLFVATAAEAEQPGSADYNDGPARAGGWRDHGYGVLPGAARPTTTHCVRPGPTPLGRSRLRSGVGAVHRGGGPRAARRGRPEGGRARNCSDRAAGSTRPHRDPGAAPATQKTERRCVATHGGAVTGLGSPVRGRVRRPTAHLRDAGTGLGRSPE